MALIRWEPVSELNTIQSEMNRLFNTFFDHSGNAGATGAARRWIPAMDLVESEDHYVLYADLPGLSDADVTVSLEDSTLTISGERKPLHDAHKAAYARLERGSGSFSRSLTLPEGVDGDKVQAHFDRGVLEILIPKPEQKKPRQVQIRLGDRTVEESPAISSAA
ncbi:Hsp20/alpha crystallin family protein [Conexibacter sp. DBS9H8]|uniref:Hsp20/alpha crystallin family protein n=1 Tax=Conexibacter sp. DBS9H8 TaxID=2937801 RepID=UPI00200F3DBE|nr:Hsp20/alpha crystallin family protein [Conexibacter sp. DBS9H8]